MSAFAVLVAASGAVLVAGLLLLVVGVRGTSGDPPPAFSAGPGLAARLRLRGRGPGPGQRARRLRWAIATAAGAGVWLLTGWPVAVVLVAGVVVGVPYLFGAGRVAENQIRRLEGLEEWCRRLADSLASGQGVVQTIVRSAEHAPEAIAPEVATLANRLATPRWDKRLALRRFADTFADPLADLVAVALTIAVSARGARRVTDVLRQLATEVSEQVRSRREVEADRAEPRSQARNIVVIQAVLVVGVIAAGDYTRPYGTVSGQLVLVALGALVLAALLWLRRLSLGQPPPRILPPVPDPAPEPQGAQV